jgi:hypothetical protein
MSTRSFPSKQFIDVIQWTESGISGSRTNCRGCSSRRIGFNTVGETGRYTQFEVA